MTTTQITEILGAANLNSRVYISDMNFISFGIYKSIVFSEPNRTRFLFDTTNEVLEVSLCRPYSNDLTELPAHGKYDTITVDGKQMVYEYLVDSNGDLLVDYYDFDAIMIINLRRK